MRDSSFLRLCRGLYARFRHLVLYGLIGSLSASLDFAVFSLLTRATPLHYLAANAVSVLFGITVSFLLNRSYNFRVRDHKWRRFFVFLSVGLGGLCLSQAILWVCVGRMGVGELPSKVASIVLVVLFQFLLNKFVTFRKRE